MFEFSQGSIPLSQLDRNVLNYLNVHVGQMPGFDAFIVLSSGTHLLKMTPMVLLLWGFWFIRDGNEAHRRSDVLFTILGSFASIAISRALSLLLPFRVRPMYNADLALQIPATMEHGVLETWSSLPSDHAAMAFALATGIFLLHRAFGILALLHATFVICLPRLYLSLHYPSDILLGALVGIVTATMVMRVAPIQGLASSLLTFERARPAIFYILFFLISSQMVEMFDGSRHLAHFLLRSTSLSLAAATDRPLLLGDAFTP